MLGVFLTSLPHAVLAESKMGNAEICKAGVATYFYLKVLPDLIGSGDGKFTFESKSSNEYKCWVDGNKIMFKWKNNQGQTMNNKGVYFSVDNEVITVDGDLYPKEFTLSELTRN